MNDTRTIKIVLPLPFYVPIEEELEIVTSYQDFAAFKFKCEDYNNQSPKSNSEIEETCTRIIIDFLPNDPELIKLESKDLLRPAVFHCITYLNNFLGCLRLVHNMNYIGNFSITDLPPVIDIEINGESYIYITTPTTILNENTPLNVAGIQEVQGRLQAWESHQYFEVIDKFRSKAIHHLYTEEFLFAITELQTSFETYIRLCHHLILLKNGADDARIEAAKEFPLKNTIVDHIGRALGEDFNYTTNPKIKTWNEKLYSYRNNIVHSGLSYISGNEAYEAFYSYQEIINYITDLMVNNGYMDDGGKVKVEDLNKNTPTDVDFDAVTVKLKERGFIK